MTRHKDFKALVRARMRETAESFTAARAALRANPPTAPTLRADAVREQRLLVDRWFAAGRLRAIPARRKVRAAILLEVVARFAPGRYYSEYEVNHLLRAVHPDVAYLRRELISLGYLCRRDGRYWVCRTPPLRTDRERRELPAWEGIWLPGFTARAITGQGR